MSKIRYNLELQPDYSGKKLNYRKSVVFAGSCFSEHIAGALEQRSFNVRRSPNGIVFNPLSLAEPFRRIVQGSHYQISDLVQHEGSWHGLHHHGVYSGIRQDEVLHKMNKELMEVSAALKNASHLFVTFGTSFAYFLDHAEFPVANCHKIPQQRFSKQMLELQAMLDEWSQLIGALNRFNPELEIVLTVSPVKHLRDGVVANMHSKARLLELAHQLCRGSEKVHYFPSFELVSEDLRDYRFYANDAAHPNDLAINYVFEKFMSVFPDKESVSFAEEVEACIKLQNHKVQSEDGEAYIRFMQHLEDKRQAIEAKYGVSL